MSNKTTSEYKMLIKNAKARMQQNDYAEARKIYQLGLSGVRYTVNNTSLTKEELRILCDRIRAIQDEDADITAIGLLADNRILANLTDSGRQRYILELARLYREIREKLKTNQMIV
jgi:hypothetical protein